MLLYIRKFLLSIFLFKKFFNMVYFYLKQLLIITNFNYDVTQVIVAGGMESMSNAPMSLPRNTPGYGGGRLYDVIVADGLTDAYAGIHMGVCGEMTASEMGISREEQDDFAVGSYERARRGDKEGRFKEEIVPFTVAGS